MSRPLPAPPPRAARRAGRLQASLGGRVNPGTAPRECRGRAETLPRAEQRYPYYYFNHDLVWTGPDGRERSKRICNDCAGYERQAAEARWRREEGYADGDAAAVRPGAVVDADTPAAGTADGSASGHAIAALGNAVVHDDAGPCGVELAERELLPDSEAALLLEIKAGVLADDHKGLADYRAQIDRYKAAAGAAALKPIVV